jgi:hypothetical protein
MSPFRRLWRSQSPGCPAACQAYRLILAGGEHSAAISSMEDEISAFEDLLDDKCGIVPAPTCIIAPKRREMWHAFKTGDWLAVWHLEAGIWRADIPERRERIQVLR